MKIAQITPGIMPIPPNGWGAVEKIIWEYKQNLQSFGHEVDIIYLDQVEAGKYDIVHIHMANLAILAAERGIPYIFSLHDHHVVHWGKNSDLYKQNLKAMKGSMISFCHAEFLIDFFDATDKLFYLPHGVNSKFFSPLGASLKNEHKILCLANNGLAGDSSIDRKGFIPAIEAARDLNIPITIAGPENNRKFFESHKEITENSEYSGLNLMFNNPSEDEILELYRSHSIFINASNLEAGHPNLTILESISCGLPTICTYEGSKKIGGLLRCSRDKEEIKSLVRKVIENYDYYRNETRSASKFWDWSIISKYLLDSYSLCLVIKKDSGFTLTSKMLLNCLADTVANPLRGRREVVKKYSIDENLILGCYACLRTNSSDSYRIEFINDDNGNLVYSSDLKSDHWAKPAIQYFVNWKIVLKDSRGNIVSEKKTSLAGKKVLIAFDSSSLGDNIAWIPIVEKFRKERRCDVFVSTFHNNILSPSYPDLNFISPGTVVNGIYAQYNIGYWYGENGYDASKHPKDPFKTNLQETCALILGVDYKEIVADITVSPIGRPTDKKYICIAPQSTSQAKYWNNPEGWQKLVDYFNSRGYEVFYVSKENPNDPNYSSRINGLTGFVDRSGLDLNIILNDIKHCEVFIGLGSGLSWAAWALKKPVVLISGFSDPSIEFSTNCERIINKNVCHGCWSRKYFDKGDWMWCPDNKNTERQFECTKSISPDTVIAAVERQISKNNKFTYIDGNQDFFTARIGG